VQSQGLRYNIALPEISSITPDSGIFHPELLNTTTQIIDTALGKQILKDDVVSKDYGIEYSDDDDEEDVINATNYRGRQPEQRNNKNR